MAGHFPDNPDKLTEKALAARVATMLTMGANRAAISKELGISYGRISTIMKSDECIRVIREITNHEKEYAKAMAAQKSAALIDECFRVIKEKLKRNDLKAVSLTLKASGVFDELEQVKNDSSLVVVMPGAVVPGSAVQQSDTINITPNLPRGDSASEEEV
jgi:hypothetical protein